MFDYRSSNTFNYFNQLNPERRAPIDALQAQIKAADGATERLVNMAATLATRLARCESDIRDIT